MLPLQAPGLCPRPGGRVTAYQCYGAPAGRPVLFFHGLPGSRLQAALLHAPAAAAGVTLLAFDRPGFGGSSPQPGASIDDVAADALALADRLGWRRFATLGVSCGGPYALAMARRWPARVGAVGLLAGMGPMDRPALRRGQLPVLRLMFALGRWRPALVSPLLALDAWLFRRDAARAVQALAALLAPPDRALLAADATLRAAFAASLAEAYRQGIAGALGEVARIARHRDAALDGIDAPVHVFQSGHDRHVPPAMGRHQAQRLAHGRLHECPDDGHLSVVVHRAADCLRCLLAADPTPTPKGT